MRRLARASRCLDLRVLLVLAATGPACESPASPDVGRAVVASVVVVPSQSTIPVGGSIQLHAVAADADGNPLPDRTVQWSSSDSGIAAVSPLGMVTAKAPGDITIMATVEGKSGAAQIEVTVSSGPPTTLQAVIVTYIGGGGEDIVRDVATDAQGNIYLAGGTNSANFPTTPGAFDTSFNNTGSDDHDVFVMKVSPSGQLLWSTFLGGPNYDRAYALEVDAQGHVYVAGRAGTGFPVTSGSVQPSFGGGNATDPAYGAQDGFLCKLTPNGDARVFCTYFGNADNAPIRDVAIDAAGDAYVITSSDTGTFPAGWFADAFQPNRRGDRDVLIARIAADGSRVVWATYIGGSDTELNTNTIRLDPMGNVLFVTTTRSADMPTPNGFDATQNGPPDLYVGKLSADGAQLLYGTYLGGSGPEFTETHHLAVDAHGNAIVAGMTRSSDLPTTPGAFQRVFGGLGGSGSGAGTNYSGDAFVSKISADGSRLIASTYLGGSAGDGSEGVSVDALGNIYVPGTTFSSDFPATEQPQGSVGNADVFAATLSPDLTTLLYARRFGGSGWDEARAGTVSAAGSFYLAGMTRSADLLTVLPLQLTRRGPNDGVFIKLQPQ